MAPIRVPKTPGKAFNKHRRPSALLLSQITHLEWALLPASCRTPEKLRAKKVQTEAHAAERIAQLTRLIRETSVALRSTVDGSTGSAPAALTPERPAVHTVLPPLPKVPRDVARPTKHARAGRKVAKPARATSRAPSGAGKKGASNAPAARRSPSTAAAKRVPSTSTKRAPGMPAKSLASGGSAKTPRSTARSAQRGGASRKAQR
jgi:hypothetical protein